MPKGKVRSNYLVNVPGQWWAQHTVLQDGIASCLAHVNDSTRLSAPSSVTQLQHNQTKKEGILLLM